MFRDLDRQLPVLGGGVSRRGLLTAAGLLTVSGCSLGRRTTGDKPMRAVTHPLGTSTVPVTPERVVSLDSNGGLQVSLELGVPLVASETLQGGQPLPPYVPAPAAGFTALGFNQLNLEQLAGLWPDMIIGNTPRLRDNYAKLSGIAPTVAYENAGSGVGWQQSVRTIGDVLGARAEIDRRLVAYTERVAALSAKYRDLLAKRSVALLRFTSNELRIVRGPIFGSSILADLGVRRPASTDRSSPSSTYVTLSEENVGALADSDILLYFVGGGGLVDKASTTFDKYTKGGLWQQLPAVRAGRVIELDPIAWWDGYSVSAAQTCLNQLDSALGPLS
ncbi:iron-siderophore ABC transporter substrate-binding protein [Allokutzneria sp. A3M-2-11 16]|uniref:iron-siderophore ABC transporter substrate-binding protein n=1 Tax=Allokutzneria sp. A3M-2-11 16 TaxID=2962043 RepID=UPI0020B80D2B|nr:iron-siderophore ABC transporter substrate-binding protein [Allokutzneria sp. A3M-2-11 16]MCP3800558.1 iron-siderophore ABC transporter substrate-binding protein [Allokutzneria sp. A3M-2-11 16]